MVNLLTKFEVCSFSHSEILKGSQITKEGRLTRSCPFDRILHFYANRTTNLKFVASVVAEILRGSQNFKNRSRDPRHTAFNLILHSLHRPNTHLCTNRIQNLKFVTSAIPEKLRGIKIFKVGHVTQFMLL